MKPGDRVRVAPTYHWAQGVSGTIEDLPTLGDEPFETRWVEFDEPQYDADGDGPYSKAAIDVRELVLIESRSTLDRLQARLRRT